MKNARHLIIPMLVMWALSVCGQPDCYMRTFSIRDGLAANHIAGLEQTPDGLMWLATWNGLCCYDGYRFITFPGESWGSSDALTTRRIAMIRANSQGNLWVRTYDGGLYLFDTHRCRYVNIGNRLEAKYGKPLKPRNIYPLPTGYTWITSSDGAMNLRVSDRQSDNIDSIELYSRPGHLLTGSYIKKVEADDKGREWIYTNQSTLLYGSNEIRQGTDSVPTRQTLTDSRGRTWTTDNHTLLWTEDRFGTVWQLTRDGHLGYYHEQTRSIMPCLQLPTVDKYHIDQQGNLWVTSAVGLSLVNFRYHRIKMVEQEERQQTRSVMCRRDGTVWGGTQNGYVTIYTADGRPQGWLAADGRVSSTRTRFSDRIYALFEDSKGRVWIGTKGCGLYVLDGQRISHYQPSPTDRYALNSANVYDIDEDEKGNLWLAAYGGGVNLAEPQADGTFRFINSDNELTRYSKDKYNNVRRITHDGHGTVLASTTTGLLTFSNQRVATAPDRASLRFFATGHDVGDTTSLCTGDVMQTLVDGEGHVYVTTLSGVVQRLTAKQLLDHQLKLQTLTTSSRLIDNALSMVVDNNGTLWMAREADIVSYQPQTGILMPFNTISTGGYVELTEAKPAVDASGRIWMGAMGGLVTFHPGEMRKSDYSPHIVFTSVAYQGDSEPQPILNCRTLTVDSDHRNLTVSFAATDYEDNYLMQYAYRMDDHAVWTNIGSSPRIAFSELSPGRHVLTVRSTNCDGVWVDNQTTLVIDVTPLLWERRWVQLFLLLLVVVVSTWAVMAWLRHRQHMREREQRLANILRQYRQLQQESMESLERQRDTEEVQTAVSGEAENHDHAHREYKLAEPQIENEDEQMMDGLMKFIEQHIGDENLRIEDMAEAASMGRTAFYQKIKELVGVSPSDFLRQVRMQRAVQLVSKSRMPISQIAYAVGFTDPKYFTKCFKKETGMTPSEYRERQP